MNNSVGRHHQASFNMTIIATASPNSFVLSGLSIPHALPAPAFHGLLGEPSRIIAAGRPAPAGHRNNQIHIYDDLGVYITEHHYTFLFTSVIFMLDPSHSPFPSLNPFSGSLFIGESTITQPFHEDSIQKSGLNFHCQLRGSWTLEGESTHWIGFTSEDKTVHSVSVCFPHDPHDDSQRRN